MRIAVVFIVAAMLVLVSASVSAHGYHRYDSHDWDRHHGYWHDDVRTVHVYRHYQPVVIHNTYTHPHAYAINPYDRHVYRGHYYW